MGDAAAGRAVLAGTGRFATAPIFSRRWRVRSTCQRMTRPLIPAPGARLVSCIQPDRVGRPEQIATSSAVCSFLGFGLDGAAAAAAAVAVGLADGTVVTTPLAAVDALLGEVDAGARPVVRVGLAPRGATNEAGSVGVGAGTWWRGKASAVYAWCGTGGARTLRSVVRVLALTRQVHTVAADQVRVGVAKADLAWIRLHGETAPVRGIRKLGFDVGALCQDHLHRARWHALRREPGPHRAHARPKR